MRSIERGAKYGEFTVGALPKISIDLHLRVLDSHGHGSPDALLTLMSDKDLVKAALVAADKILETFDRFLSHIEVVKVWYAWNLNGGFRPLINARIVLVEPGTGKKLEAEGEADISCILEKESLRWAGTRPGTIEASVAALTKRLQDEVMVIVDQRRKERETLAGDLQKFDLLFQA